MRFSTTNFARFAVLSTLSAQVLGNPIAYAGSHDDALSRRGFSIPKPPKDPDPVVGSPGSIGRLPGGVGDVPGAAGGSGARSAGKTPDQIAQYGSDLNARLDTAIRTNAAERQVPSIFESNSGYNVAKTANKPMSHDDLDESVLNPAGDAPAKFPNQRDIKYENYEIRNADGEAGKPKELIMDASVSKDDGIIHTPHRYADEDTLPDDAKIRISDQMFQVWKDAPGTKGLDNLKVQTALQIDNPETKAMIRAAHDKHDIGEEEGAVGTWKPDSPEYNQFLGSDNGRPLVRMLADYHNELGNLKITQVKSVFDEDGMPNLMFYVGKMP